MEDYHFRLAPTNRAHPSRGCGTDSEADVATGPLRGSTSALGSSNPNVDGNSKKDHKPVSSQCKRRYVPALAARARPAFSGTTHNSIANRPISDACLRVRNAALASLPGKVPGGAVYVSSQSAREKCPGLMLMPHTTLCRSAAFRSAPMGGTTSTALTRSSQNGDAAGETASSPFGRCAGYSRGQLRCRNR